MYYYKGKMVSSPRFFTVGNENKVEFELDGETHITDGSEVVDYYGMKLAQKASEEATKALEKSVEKSNETKEEAKEETKTESEEEIAQDNDNSQEEETNTFTSIVATNVKSKRKHKLNTEQEFSKFVNRYKLDEVAIQDVLDGKQKTHKGFSFDK